MARTRIKRRQSGRFGRYAAIRAMIALAVIMVSAGGVQTFAAVGRAFSARGALVTILLDPAKPYNPQVDPAQLLQSALPVAEPVITGSVDPLAGTPATPFVMPESSAFSTGAAASPFFFKSRNANDALRASLCLTAAIYYEAANEPDDGQRAVAQVVLNRVRHPAWPDTVCDVVYQGTERPGTLCQFTFGCDGALARAPSTAGWIRARRVAQAALSGYVHAPAGLATHYHTLAVAPSWGKSLTPVGIYGAHIFYRLPGGAGAPRAFYDSYRGHEPLPGPRAKIGAPAIDPSVFAAATAVLPSAIMPPPVAGAAGATPSPAPVSRVEADRRYVPGALPESDIRDEYRNSGQWIAR